MIGHDPAKPGIWYEEGFVVLQLIRLLAEEVESVTWERLGEPGQGIDCLVVENGQSTAVQCKTRSTGSWTISALRREGVLQAARERLEAEHADLFRLVTNAPSPDLSRLIKGAANAETADTWWEAAKDTARTAIMEAWGLSAEQPEDRAHAYGLVRRMECVTTSATWIEGHFQSLCRQLTGTAPPAVYGVLVGLARKNLTRSIRIDDAHAEIASAGIVLQPRATGPRVHDRLSELVAEFQGRLVQRRRLAKISRTESEDALRQIDEADPGKAVVVHGPAGSGKSEVLAAVVKQLDQRGIPVLALLPDMDEAEVNLGDDPIAALLRYSASRPAVVVLDQLDQVFTSTGSVQRMQRRCREWIARARRYGLRVVVGCRTVDAEHDTQLRHVLGGDPKHDPVRILVGDLPDPTVDAVLANAGIATFDLEPAVRRLARRPLLLGLLLDIHRQGTPLGGLRSVVSVVDRWWRELSSSLLDGDERRATKALDDVLEQIHRHGALWAPEDSCNDSDAIEALVTAGVLVRDRRCPVARITPVHQVLADVRIAQRWRNVDSVAELLSQLGPTDQQTLHHARRLRLAVPLLLERANGIGLIDAVMRSASLRPLLRRSILLGLAELDPLIEPVERIVAAWLEDDVLRDSVLSTTIWGRPTWIQSLSDTGWLDRAWDRWTNGRRDRLLSLLASVSVDWGDGVARHLARWARTNSEVLERSDAIFQHEPGEDSDELFKLRLEHIARQATAIRLPDWRGLLERHPKRALRLLATLLASTSPESLCAKDPHFASDFPDEAPAAAVQLGRQSWEQLRGWWLAFSVDNMIRTPARWHRLSDWLVAKIVELIAASLAHALAHGELGLADILEALPMPLRDIDGWLLLRVGAHLSTEAEELGETMRATEALVDWFTSDHCWANLRVGYSGGWWDFEQPRAFVAKIASLCSDESLAYLEQWIAEYPDPWSAENERARVESGTLRHPSTCGLTAWRLLPAMPEGRRSAAANRRLGELRRKFADWPHIGIQLSGGWITSIIPDDVADGWTVEEWVSRVSDPKLTGQSANHPQWRQLDRNTAGEYSLRQLCDQLRRVAERDPLRFFEHAGAFNSRVPADARAAVLAGVSRLTPPSTAQSSDSWNPVPDAALAEIFERREYLDDEECLREIAWSIQDRPAFAWSDVIVRRLCDAARGGAVPGISLESDESLLMYRHNETACMALGALTAVAVGASDRRSKLLQLAADIVEHEDPGRRASAAALAAACYSAEPTRAARLVIDAAVDPRVCTEPEVRHALLWLAAAQERPATERATARDRLLAAARDERDHVASTGGQMALRLREEGVITDEELWEAISAHPAARRGIAAILASRLTDKKIPAWLVDLTVKLADDQDEDIGDAVLHALEYPPASQVVEDPDVLGRLLETAASRRSLDPLLAACDRQDNLLPLARRIINLGSQAAAESSESSWTWKRHRHLASVVGLLARLVEEAEREGRFEMLATALDAWDELVEAGVTEAARDFDKRIRDA